MALTSEVVRTINQGSDKLVTEHHVDAAGKTHVLTYVVANDAYTAALLTAHAADLAEMLAANELEDLING